MARQLGGNINPASGGLFGTLATLQNGDIVSASFNTMNVLSPQGVLLDSRQSGQPGYKSLAPLPNGNFGAVTTGSVGDVIDQIYSPSGAPLGSPVTVFSQTSFFTDAAALPNGQFVATWASGANFDTVHAALLNADGSVANGNLLSVPGGSNVSVSVSALANGGFIVTWDDPNGGIDAQIFDATGQAAGAQFAIDPRTTGFSNDVVGLKNGNYVVTYADSGQTNEIDAQIYNGTSKVGPVIRVADAVFAGGENITLLGDGDFVITWDERGNNNSVAHAQTYHADGTPFGAEVTIPNSSVGAVTAVGADRFVMDFSDNSANMASTAGIFGASDDASHSELIQNRSTGAIDALSLNGATLTQSSLGADLWPVVGEGDFNGDGQMDLVTQKNGAIDFVFMQGSQIVGSDLVSGNYWNVVGSGYLPGFGESPVPELITQNAAGQIDLLHFNNGAADQNLLLSGTYNRVVGAGDFYGDGNAEIATQNSAGQIDLLTFKGSSLVSSALVPGHYWTVKGVADVNHDGISDFITQNSATGQIDYLMMNGSQVTGSLLENTAYPGWNVVGASQTADQALHGA